MSSDTGNLDRKLVLPTEALIHTTEPTKTTRDSDIEKSAPGLIVSTEVLIHTIESTAKTTTASDTEKRGRKLVLPTEALIHTVEPTTTTTTKAVAFDPRRHSRKRSSSRDALSALTSPAMSTSSSSRKEDYGFPSRPQKAEHDVVKTEGSGYEAFPAFDSWAPRSRFNLTRSLSLRSPLVSQPGRRRLFRALTTAGPAPACRKAQPRSLESEAERVAWMGEALARTQVCLWAGPWRRRPSGEFICPCGEHRLGADSQWVKNLEDKMRGLVRGGGPKEGE